MLSRSRLVVAFVRVSFASCLCFSPVSRLLPDLVSLLRVVSFLLSLADALPVAVSAADGESVGASVGSLPGVVGDSS